MHKNYEFCLIDPLILQLEHPLGEKMGFALVGKHILGVSGRSSFPFPKTLLFSHSQKYLMVTMSKMEI